MVAQPRPRAEVPSVLEATRRTLRKLGADDVAPALAASAERLAMTADVTTAARELPALTKELRAVLADIEALSRATAKQESAVDDLAARRAERLAKAADPQRAGSSEQRGG